jgi:hypothetical protein
MTANVSSDTRGPVALDRLTGRAEIDSRADAGERESAIDSRVGGPAISMRWRTARRDLGRPASHGRHGHTMMMGDHPPIT